MSVKSPSRMTARRRARRVKDVLRRAGAHRTVVRPIRTEADYDRTAAELDRLVLRDDLDAAARDHLDVLTALVEHYDDAHYRAAMEQDTRPVRARLKSLLASSGTSPAQLGDIIGSRPAASMVLAGRRELSKAHIRTLAAHFKMNAAYFI